MFFAQQFSYFLLSGMVTGQLNMYTCDFYCVLKVKDNKRCKNRHLSGCRRRNTHHTVVGDDHDLQIFHLLKYAARHLQNKPAMTRWFKTCNLRSHYYRWFHQEQTKSHERKHEGEANVLHKFAGRVRQRRTARFFLRFSQDNSSSSERSCSSSTGNTHTHKNREKNRDFSTHWITGSQSWGVVLVRGGELMDEFCKKAITLTLLLWIAVPHAGSGSSELVRPCSCFLQEGNKVEKFKDEHEQTGKGSIFVKLNWKTNN